MPAPSTNPIQDKIEQPNSGTKIDDIQPDEFSEYDGDFIDDKSRDKSSQKQNLASASEQIKRSEDDNFDEDFEIGFSDEETQKTKGFGEKFEGYGDFNQSSHFEMKKKASDESNNEAKKVPKPKSISSKPGGNSMREFTDGEFLGNFEDSQFNESGQSAKSSQKQKTEESREINADDSFGNISEF